VRKGILMVLLALGAMACGVLASRFAARAAQGFAANLRENMFHKSRPFPSPTSTGSRPRPSSRA
jgi:hypothetical protein